MVIYYLNILNVITINLKAYSILIVYSYTVLSFSISSQMLKMIARRNLQIVKASSIIDHDQVIHVPRVHFNQVSCNEKLLLLSFCA